MLVKPLETLLTGVGKVNEGDLSVEVPVRVEDEIGFLSRSFNGMVASIRLAQKKLRDYADTLEEKVEERTAELQATLKQVQDLKHQQDGDYFLTALLTRPLGANQVKSKSVDVDFLVQQKKQFSFRKKSDEIGGDLCKAHNICLRGHDYVVFLNADAMGKSIQGAGGSLVLGSVLESIINRTRASESAQKIYPERWLKNAFLELHKVMESFDGSMLISVVFGLVDEENGFLYYINAEHPASVIYRNGEASFLDEDLLFRKLGTQGVSGKLYILTHQLQHNDVLIAGSDGRDDLLLGHTEKGNRIINENEFLFVDTVRDAEGNLKTIKEFLLKRGDLTDDLSLLRVKYHGDGPNKQIIPTDARNLLKKAHNRIRNNNKSTAFSILATLHDSKIPQVHKELGIAYQQMGDFESAARHSQQYIDTMPMDNEMIYRTSLIYKRLRKLEDAADLAERIRLRQPGNIANLISLADIYLNLNNARRAEKIINLALEIDASHAKALLVKNHIKKLRLGRSA